MKEDFLSRSKRQIANDFLNRNEFDTHAGGMDLSENFKANKF